MRNELLILLGILLLALLMVLGGPTVTLTVTTSSVWDRSKPLKEIDLSSMQHLTQGEITVYFEPQQRRLAGDVIHALRQGWQLVAGRLGIALGAFGVVLVALSESERAEIGGIYLKQQVKQSLLSALQQRPRSPNPPFPVKVPPGLQSLQEADLKTRLSIYLTMPHEMLHRAVNEALESGLDKGWRSDLRTRGFEDGLAEYVGYIVSKEFDLEVHRHFLEGRRKNVQEALQGREPPTYNLTQEFLGHREVYFFGREDSRRLLPQGAAAVKIAAGYGVSLAFWLQIAQKHGEGVIKTFWQRISQRGFPNAKEAARILSELTGEDIWQKLQNMDLHEVLRTLEQAAGAP